MLFPVLYCILAAVSMAAAVYCFVLYFKRRKREDLVVDNNTFFLMSGSALFFGITIVYLVIMGEWKLCLIPAVVCVLCLLGLCSWHNEIIFFDESGFTRRDIFFRSSRHSYQDITECGVRILRQTRKHSEQQMILSLGSKRFTLSPKAANYEKFAAFVREYGREGIDLRV